MALIKYYDLESQSWEDVSDLERNLQKHLLDKKHVRSTELVSVDDLAASMNGDADPETMARLEYDSGDFDVLYRKSSTISKGKKRWFGKNIPPRVGTEIVVRARPEDILELQDYLGSSGFEVVEARGVTRATFNFATVPANEHQVACYSSMLTNLVKRDYPDVNYEVQKNDGVVWDGKNGTTCVGMFDGRVLDILKLRKQIISSASTYGNSVKTKSINFS